jgi:hypothetical protein
VTFNFEAYEKLKADMDARQNAYPDVCYWVSCDEERIAGSLYCLPHGFRAALQDHLLFRRPNSNG